MRVGSHTFSIRCLYLVISFRSATNFHSHSSKKKNAVGIYISQFIESEDTHASRYTIGLQVFIHASVRFSSGLTICVRVNCSKNELVSLLDKAENRMSTTFSCDRREDIAPLRKRDSFADVYST